MDEQEDQTIAATYSSMEQALAKLEGIAPLSDPIQILSEFPEVGAPEQRLVLIELLKCDLKAAARSGNIRNIEFYYPVIAAFLPRDEIPFDLVLEEVKIRRDANIPVTLEEYRERFPDLAVTIGRWLVAEHPSGVDAEISGAPALGVGQRVDDFEIRAELGRGAFASVYLAEQKSMRRLVAMKVSHSSSSEPSTLSRLDHPNIVRVFDQRFLMEPTCVVLTMQYLSGGTLLDVLRLLRSTEQKEWNGKLLIESVDRSLVKAGQGKPERSELRQKIATMDWPTTVAWLGIQLAEGLHYAHEQSVLHRDLKPANILMSMDGVPKLVDFNVSWSDMREQERASSFFGGSLAYMSPEQLAATHPDQPVAPSDLDNRSDLYSLGLVLWELWRGHRPFQTDNISSEWVSAIEEQQLLRTHLTRLSGTAISGQGILQRSTSSASERSLEQTLSQCLAVQPDDRLASGRELAAALRLSLEPEISEIVRPAESSWRSRIYHTPYFLIALLCVFLPNTIAARFNYVYNASWMQAEHAEAFESFRRLSMLINSVVFPLGAVLFAVITWRAIQVFRETEFVEPRQLKLLDRLTDFPLLATSIAGLLWLVSGFAFSIALSQYHSQFPLSDAVHFFFSLAICGGIAWVYPFFLLKTFFTEIAYPQLVGKSLTDTHLTQRRTRIKRRCGVHLMLAALIPLAAMALLLLRENLSKSLLFGLIVVAVLGLALAFFLSNRIEYRLSQLSKVIRFRTSNSI